MADGANRAASGETLRGSLARLADALLGLLRTRLELASLEYTEERSRVTTQVGLLLTGVVCLLFALFFAAAGVIAWFWDTHRFAAIIGVIVFFAAAGAAVLWRRAELANNAAPPFAATIAELEKDRASIGRTMNLPPT